MHFNSKYTEDFILAGIVTKEEKIQISLEELRQILGLQENVIDIKYKKHFAEKDFLSCTNKPRLRKLLTWINNSPLYIHYLHVNNLDSHVLAYLCETFEIKPMINQVEMHPFFQQQNNLDIMNEYNIVPEAWGPFNEGKRDFFTNPILRKSVKNGRTMGSQNPFNCPTAETLPPP